MKKMLFGILGGLLIATAVGAYQAEDKKSESPMGGMMQGMKMMGEQSPEMTQQMKEMMARMSKMMDMCSQMMSNNRSNQQPENK